MARGVVQAQGLERIGADVQPRARLVAGALRHALEGLDRDARRTAQQVGEERARDSRADDADPH